MTTGKTASLSAIDQTAIWLAVAGLTAVSWAALVDMGNMDMQGMDAMSAMQQSMSMQTEWSATDFWSMFVMWAVMMVAMMVPTAARTLMVYARIARQYQQSAISSTYVFLVGYITVWTGFSVAATLLQWQLDRAALLTPMLVSNSYLLGAALLVAAGIFQLTPYKDVCLKHCQSPVDFISRNFKKGSAGALLMGLQHGAYCLGCCWLLMGLLFLAGVMNLWWILLITLFVLLEKLLPLLIKSRASIFTRGSGFLMILAGITFLLLE